MAGRMAQVQGRAVWWLLLALFAAGTVGWSLATPLMASGDEGAHAVRAAGVARGQLLPPRRHLIVEVWVQRVPEAYAQTGRAGCFNDSPMAVSRTPVCMPSFHGSRRLVKVPTYEFRGSPVLYGVLGIPSLVIPDRYGMYAMRLMCALAGAAFLASATVAALRRRARLAVVGVLVAATPMVWYLAGMVNPNGIEIAAAIAAWSALVALARDDSVEADTRLVTRAGLALVVLVAVRGLGPGFGALALVTAWLLATPERRRVITGLSYARKWAVGIVASAALTVAWIAVVGTELKQAPRVGVGLVDALDDLPRLAVRSVGAFGVDFMELPRPGAWIWIAVAVLGVVLACAFGGPRRTAALVLVGAATVLLPVSANGFNLPDIGFEWQGRYGLPVTVGLVIVAFGVIEIRRPWIPTVGVACAVTTLVLQVVATVSVGRHLGMGRVSGPNVLDYVLSPRWQPAIPSAVFLVVAIVVSVGLGLIVIPVVLGRVAVGSDLRRGG